MKKDINKILADLDISIDPELYRAQEEKLFAEKLARANEFLLKNPPPLDFFDPSKFTGAA
ncbi:MAG: hypothetical protein V4616_08355 [Bacteroidota bacterium]